MLNKSRMLVAALMASAVSRFGTVFSGTPRSQGPSPFGVAPRKIKPGKAKGHRTIRAEGAYGRNLRVYFDSQRRTPAQSAAFKKTITTN